MGQVKGLLIDIAGVLTDGNAAIAGSAEAIRSLQTARFPFRLVTNTTSKPKRRLCLDLADAGFDISPEAVFAPAQSAAAFMLQRKLAPHLLTAPSLAEDFADLPSKGRIAVVVGDAGRWFDYNALNAAFRHLMDGAEFLALAINRRYRDADGGLSLDAGAFVAALEYASERRAVVLGKPAPPFFETAAASMNLALGEVAMIGDDAEADVAGALRAGVAQGYLVRTGKYEKGDEARVDPAPTATVRNFAEAAALVLP